VIEVGPDLIDTFVPGDLFIRQVNRLAGLTEALDTAGNLEQRLVSQATHRPLTLRPQGDLLEQYTRVLHAVAQQQPLLVLLDDLQWADVGSIGLLFHLARRLDDSRILIVAAYRPAEVSRGRWGERHPLEPVVNELKLHFGPIEINLSRAEDRHFVDTLLDVEPNGLGEAFRQTLFRLTAGHPLFTVELLRGMQERGDLIRDQRQRWIEGPKLDWDTLPARVEAVLAERVGQLSGLEQAILTVASVEGEIFTAEVIARVQGRSQSETVHELSTNLERTQRLVHALGVRERNGRHLSQYRFCHCLFQKYLYSRLDPVERVYLHEAVGLALEKLYGESAG
jgi:predicted ATPase